jgi:hypothetical protein
VVVTRRERESGERGEMALETRHQLASWCLCLGFTECCAPKLPVCCFLFFDTRAGGSDLSCSDNGLEASVLDMDGVQHSARLAR